MAGPVFDKELFKRSVVYNVKTLYRKTLEEANNQARENLGSLATERDSLTNQVEALRKTVSDYRERFTALLQAQQDAMDKISDL